ncbi:MAG: IS4/IS5 family transposase, partial [Lentisphaerae bacterium]|nr:IS4/IS5 family transposase [Lentisphaerota bacterium]
APPGKAPALGEIATMVAQLGGYIVRKNSPPGPQTIWSGLQRAYDFSLGWKMFFRGAGKPG